MAQERKELNINGDSLDLEADWTQKSGGGLVGFLAQHSAQYPWFFGITAITIITVYPEPGQAILVQLTGIICVSLITIVSTWKWSNNERKGTTQFSDVSSNTG